MTHHVEDSLAIVASALLPQSVRVDRAFRRALETAGFSLAEIEALCDVTPAAAAASWERVERGAHRLVLMNVDHARILRALTAYDKAAESVYKRAAASGIECGRKHLRCALLLAISEARATVQEHEHRALRHVLDAEARAKDAASFRELAAASVRGDFGASAAVLGQTPKPRAAVRATCEFSPVPRKADWLIDASWNDRVRSVWSAPAGSSLLQLGFEQPRRMYAREAELLGVLGRRLGCALRHFESEARQRAMSLQMLDVEELERVRISRNLHDDAAQALALIRLQLEMMETGPADWAAVQKALAETRTVTEQTIVSIRRLLSDLTPAVLQQMGLAAAARQLARRLRADASVHVRVQVGALPELPTRISLGLYRILQEAFANIARHAGASHVSVCITATAAAVKLSVQDDGVGFDPAEVARRARCYGLTGIRLRVLLLDGVLSVRSREDGGSPSRNRGGGTHLTVHIPLTGEHPNSFEL